MKTLRFAHLDSTMRIVWEPDRDPVPEEVEEGAARAAPRDAHHDASKNARDANEEKAPSRQQPGVPRSGHGA